ncbi:hypothetical protein ROHU_025823 [Labeo rohita]|uniref:Uncharacterized protein n=1 Tax=Labeo rohita TaxID=84645 RepID=A0A498MDW8_LABRO|nr:hypothetical protein ROHU_025823 [Labeo rohita]
MELSSLRRSVKSRSRGRLPTRVELTWASTARKAPPGAQHPRLRIRQVPEQGAPTYPRAHQSHACVGLRPLQNPHGRRTYTSRYILVSRRRVKGPSPPENAVCAPELRQTLVAPETLEGRPAGLSLDRTWSSYQIRRATEQGDSA